MKSILKKWLKKHNLFIPLIIHIECLKDTFRSVIYQLILFPQKGKGYTCNFCGATYSSFISLNIPEKAKDALEKHKVIAGDGANNICPKCLSTSRERLVKIAIENHFKRNNTTILHFGPTQKEYDLLHKIGKVTTIDLRPAYYKLVDPTIIFGDATQLSFDDESFDYVVANHILEHIPDDMAAMKEIYRVLKKGGTALLQVPFSEYLATTFEQPDINDSQLQAALFGQGDHVRIYALPDYIHRLEIAGFSVQIIKNDFLQAYRHFALQHNEVIILAHK
jgi:SAM-dependent methyltransferase